MSTLLKFELGGNVLQFEDGSQYPQSTSDRIYQVTDRSAGGQLHVENLGINTKTKTLNFFLMSVGDYTALLNWFLNVAEGSKNTFDYTDEYGNTNEVRIISNILDFSETSFERYSGILVLEFNNA